MRTQLLLAVLLFSIPALAQEPQGVIKPQETISVAALHSTPATSSDSTSLPAPIVLPVALPCPAGGLGEYARRVRRAHTFVPKARTVVNDDAPIEEIAFSEFR